MVSLDFVVDVVGVNVGEECDIAVDDFCDILSKSMF